MGKQTLGDAIRAARKKRNMTQRDLAEKIGISFQQISKYERNIDRPPDLNVFARVLGMEVNPWLR